MFSIPASLVFAASKTARWATDVAPRGLNRHFKNKKNKFIETIDLFPSLLYRYSKNKYSKNRKYFDGKNLIYSNYQKDRVISESVREPEFQIQIKTKNLTSYTFFDLNKFNIGKAKITKYYDNMSKKYKKYLNVS